MPFTKNKDIDFKIENNRIVLSDQYKNKNLKRFKKITGSRFFNVLNLNKFCSPFMIWCQMVNIYEEPMDPLLANAGNVIEPKIRHKVEELTNQKFLVHNPRLIGFDVFKENPIFGGIPDGEPLKNGKLDYPNSPILEIKTSSIDSFLYKKIDHVFKLQYENDKPIIKSYGTKRDKWFNSNNDILIPDEYKFQLGLYCYLRNTSKGLFAVCFLEYDDYLNPENCDLDKREIQLIEYEVDLDKIKHWVLIAENWYKNHILTGISPEMTKEDKVLVDDLLGK